MAIVTSTPNQENKVKVYDIPDSQLSQYELASDKATQMFPEGSQGAVSKMSAAELKKPEGAGDVDAYAEWCVCRTLWCNAYGCWYEYYWCYC
jgi:hypothetical protein